MRLMLVLLLFGFLGGTADAAGQSWSGTWRDGRAKDLPSELRTIDHGNGDIEFQLEIWGGPPAYNSGGAEGHVLVKAGKAIYETTEFDGLCRIEFAFAGKEVRIRQTKGTWAECGFGHNILADGTFKRVSRKVPTFVRR